MVAPILPGITDDRTKLREVVRAAIDAGATHISPIMLHLRPVVREEYMRWLADEFPDLVPSYEAMYAKNAYGPVAQRKATTGKVSELVREAGGLRLKPGIEPRVSPRRRLQEQPVPVKGDQFRLL
jgi:DNA repair photolyase